jgi:hypothetical protein
MTAKMRSSARVFGPATFRGRPQHQRQVPGSTDADPACVGARRRLNPGALAASSARTVLLPSCCDLAQYSVGNSTWSEGTTWDEEVT